MVRRKLRIGLIASGIILVVVAATHTIWLAALGMFLVKYDTPAPADLAVVIGGDPRGDRILMAAELVRKGFAPKVLVAGSDGFFGGYECDLAIPFVVKRGYPEDWFIPLRHHAHSTYEEAQVVGAELRRRNVRRFLLVTSEYHTRRAGAIYRSMGRDMEVRVVGAPDEVFRANAWWHIREARKMFFFEWAKTISGVIGL